MTRMPLSLTSRSLPLRLGIGQPTTKIDNKIRPREINVLKELRGRGLPFQWENWEWLPEGEDSDRSFHLETCSQKEA